jgi:hypothetical protein
MSVKFFNFSLKRMRSVYFRLFANVILEERKRFPKMTRRWAFSYYWVQYTSSN